MRFAVVLLVLLPCLALGGLRGFVRRFLNGNCGVPGGTCMKSGENLSYQNLDLVNWGVEQIKSRDNSFKDWAVKQVNSFSTQVVAGTLYTIDVNLLNVWGDQRQVVFKIFDQPWTNTKEVTVVKNELVVSKWQPVVKPVEVTLPNLPMTAPVFNLPSNIPQFDLPKNLPSNLPNMNGAVYQAPSIPVFDLPNLPNMNGAVFKAPSIPVFDLPTMAPPQSNLPILKPVEAKPVEVDGCKIPGGVCKQTDVTLDNGAQEILTWGLQQAAMRENSLVGYTLEKVNSHSKQVVSGFNYIFDVTVVNAEGHKRHVQLKVYDQSWTRTRQLTFLKNEAL